MFSLFNKKSKLTSLIEALDPIVPISEKDFNAISWEFKKGDSDIYIAIAGDYSAVKNNEGDKSIKIISAGIHEGKKTLWVFSSKKSLLETMSKKDCNYIKMKSKDALEMAGKNNFEKIILDRLIPLYRLPDGMITETISSGTNVVIGIPKDPIPNEIIAEIVEKIKNIPTIIEIYHYLQIDNEERLVIGILAYRETIDERMKVYEIIRDSIKGLSLNYPIDSTWFDINSETYKFVKELEGTLVYQKGIND